MRLGIERLLCGDVPGLDLPAVRRRAVAIVTHAAAVTADLRPSLHGLRAAGVTPRAIVTPEHGFSGAGAPGSGEPPGAAPAAETAGERVIDGYNRRRTDPGRAGAAQLAEQLRGIELILVDLSDLGARCSTYVSLLDDTLHAAARLGAEVVVCDRPNPLGRAVAGPMLDPALRSHVGRLAAPLRHGLTIGEAARMLAPADLQLTVASMTGWDPARGRGDRPWVPPAPNLPTADAALCYAGTVLLEGVTGAEPRGTTSPFQILGADWIDAAVVAALRDAELPGLAVRATAMAPTSGPHRGEVLPAVALHVTDPAALDPVGAALELLAAALAAGHELGFTEHFDHVSGDADLAGQLRAGTGAGAILAAWAQTPVDLERWRLY